MTTIKITAYINESDQWKGQSLYLELLEMLQENGIAGGTVLHAVAGFTSHGHVETTTLVDVGSRLPLVVEFIDHIEKVEQVLPIFIKMIGQRLVVREIIEIVSPQAF